MLVSYYRHFYFGRWAGQEKKYNYRCSPSKVKLLASYINRCLLLKRAVSDFFMFGRGWNQGQGWIRARDGQKSFASSGSVVMTLHLWLKDVPWSKHRIHRMYFLKKGNGHLQFIDLDWFRWAIYRAILNMDDHITYTRNIPCFDRGTSGRVSSCSVGLRRLCFGIAWDPHLAAQHLRRAWFVLGVELDTSWLGFSALIAVSCSGWRVKVVSL